MFPGMGGRADPRQMNQMMKRLGIDIQEIDDVTEVVIRTPTREYRFDKADVSIMTAQGQKTYQVVGNPKIIEKGSAAAPAELAIDDEDVKMVAEQTGKSVAEARKALESTKGDIAEAILQLQG
jgi:nascent polypeptide-associated complex subunit alpha